MSENTENHTIALLQEMRREMREIRGEIAQTRGELTTVRTEVRDGFADVTLRMDGMTHMLTLLAGNTYQLDQRVDALEIWRGQPQPDG